MRAEDKAVDGRDLERDERQQESELEKDADEEVPELVVDEARELATGQRELLFEAMRAIVERRTLVVNDLALPAHEKRALEALKVAVDGRDAELGQFVYAEDRAELLEQALAILQPNLTYGSNDLLVVIERVSELRAKLTNLGDAQDELMDANAQIGIAKADGDKDDDEDGGEGAKEKKSTLSEGPEVAVEEKKKSMLDDDAPEPEPEPEPEPVAEEQGAEPAKEGEKKKSWWRRPFG